MSLTVPSPDGHRPANTPEQPGDPAASRCIHLQKNISNQCRYQALDVNHHSRTSQSDYSISEKQRTRGTWSPHRTQENMETSQNQENMEPSQNQENMEHSQTPGENGSLTESGEHGAHTDPRRIWNPYRTQKNIEPFQTPRRKSNPYRPQGVIEPSQNQENMEADAVAGLHQHVWISC